jgi:hypothetical protein
MKNIILILLICVSSLTNAQSITGMVPLDKIYIESTKDEAKLSYLLQRCSALYTVMAIGVKEHMNNEKLFNYYYQGYSTFATMSVLNDMNVIKKRKPNSKVDDEWLAKNTADAIKRIIDLYKQDIANEKARSGNSFSNFFNNDFALCQKIEKELTSKKQ